MLLAWDLLSRSVGAVAVNVGGGGSGRLFEAWSLYRI
jgi:hypothetical protein